MSLRGVGIMILDKINFVDEAIQLRCHGLFTTILSKTGLLRDARNDEPSLFELGLTDDLLGEASAKTNVLRIYNNYFTNKPVEMFLIPTHLQKTALKIYTA
jgi:hypothetical protein